MIITKKNAYIALAGLAVVAIFAPGPEPSMRQLQEQEARKLGNSTYYYDDNDFDDDDTAPDRKLENGTYYYDDNNFDRSMALSSPTPPPAIVVTCPAGQQEYKVSWNADMFEAFNPEQTITLTNGMEVLVKNYDTGNSITDQYSVLDTAEGPAVVFGTKTTIVEDVVIEAGGQPPHYPENYGTMEFSFPEDINDLYISIGDVDSTSKVSDCTRIRMFDVEGEHIPLTFATTGTIVNVDNYAFESQPNKKTNNPGYESSLYARAHGAVRTIRLDQSSLAFTESHIGKTSRRGIFPALDFVYCADITPAPVETPAPVATPAPQPGVISDPLIMGLAGQLFKFEGRNGAWYSYASAPSFQWNMKINQFEGCPEGSDKFTTGFGLSVFDGENTEAAHRIEINVVNEHNVATGCGYESHKANDFGCLGSGSLEIVIDGHKVSRSIDHGFEDKSGRIIAYNTIASCSRRWFDFDMTPATEIGTSTVRGRRLTSDGAEGIFSVLDNIKDTTINKAKCQAWMAERRARGDILEQPGTWSTVVIKTDKISFHVEYKQEQERCNANSLDVWISKVKPEVLKETWEGIVGETKPTNAADNAHVVGTTYLSREQALKFPRDEDYEVIAPFSVDCNGCTQRGA